MALTKVSTPAIKDEAITLAKLLHGDSNSNGKFLRANNGTDPTFETIDLTALSASNLTSGTLPDARFPATLPAVSAANLTNIPAANITGTLPAIDGSNLTGITSTTINNNAADRIITGEGGTTLNGESTLTYANPNLEINTDSSPYGCLILNGNSGGLVQFEDNEVAKWSIFGDSAFNVYQNDQSASRFYIDSSGNVGIGKTPSRKLDIDTSHYVVTSSGQATTGIHLDGTAGNAGEYGGGISFACGNSGSAAIAARQATSDPDVVGLSFFTHDSSNGSANAVEKVRIHDGGTTSFNNGIGLGNGLTYAAGNTLEDYEEGTFTPNIQDATSGGNSVSGGTRQGKYVKVGSHVTVMVNCRSLSNSGMTGAHQMFVTNLPFRMSGVEQIGVFTQLRYFNNISNTQFGTHFQINNNQTIMRLSKLADNSGDVVPITFNHWMYSSGYFAFHCSFSYYTDQ